MWFEDEDLDAHLLEQHLEAPGQEHQCPHCGKPLQNESLERHLQQEHKELRVPGGLSEAQETRIREIIEEETGFYHKLLLLLIAVLALLWFLGVI